jgi:hypothetical protein
MTTADIVRERAIVLAREGTEHTEAVDRLLEACEGRRVAAVRARQQLDAQADDRDGADATRALELIDEVLERLPV